MDLKTATVEKLTSIPTPPRASETMQILLDQCNGLADEAIKYSEQMISHVGGPLTEDPQEPSLVGMLGKASDLRTKLHRLNARLTQLGGLL